MTIKVQNTLYKVHGGLLRQKSPTFKAMFSMPTGEIATAEGLTAERPIFLEQITSEEFSDLLYWIYKM
jgi:hypothetical protein